MCNVFTVHTNYDNINILLRAGRDFMSKTTNLSIRIDKELKEQAESLFSELGMNMTTAFNVFVRQAVRQGKIPFEISLNQPNNETLAAMEEANIISKDPSAKAYSDVDELFEELDS